jgi:hypothetical protein
MNNNDNDGLTPRERAAWEFANKPAPPDYSALPAILFFLACFLIGIIFPR